MKHQFLICLFVLGLSTITFTQSELQIEGSIFVKDNIFLGEFGGFEGSILGLDFMEGANDLRFGIQGTNELMRLEENGDFYIYQGRLDINSALGSNIFIGNGGQLANGCCSTVIGREAGLNIADVNSNTFVGYAAGRFTTGGENVFVGTGAGENNTGGNGNVYLGSQAGLWSTGFGNIMIGLLAGQSDTTGNDNIIIGTFADVAADGFSNSMTLGSGSVINASDKVRIGNNQVTVIEGQVDWSFISDGRFKSNVREEVKGLDFIMKLRPVTYNFNLPAYNEHVRPDGWRDKLTERGLEKEKSSIEKSKSYTHSGFIAQEVEKAAKSIGYEFSGIVPPQNEKDNYGLRYGSFVVPLVKATQEQQEELLELKEIVVEQDERIAQLERGNSKLMSEMANMRLLMESLVKSKETDD